MQKFFETYGIADDVIAAGVSGGADSLALALRLHECGKRVVALTVDHGLRPESRPEAEFVGRVMRRFGIEHHILTWEGEKPQSGIEETARRKRYELLFGWCLENGVKTLAVGHHRRDQAETFLLRLQRGSGVDGLSCMLPVTERGGIKIIRPQLEDDPEELKNYLRERKIDWAEDASNRCDDFLRVKIRKFLPELEQVVGLSAQRLAETAAVLARTRAYLQQQTEKFVAARVRRWEGAAVSVSLEALAALHPELAFRVLGLLIKEIGGGDYAPEAQEVLRLSEQLRAPAFRGCTLGGCEFVTARRRLWIVPEVRDGRVLSVAEWRKCLQNLPQYAKADLPYKVRRAIYNHLKKNKNGQE